MRPHPLLALLAGVLTPIVIALQGATFGYVVSIERRLTRLETLQEVRRGAHVAPTQLVRLESEGFATGVE